MGGTSGIRHEPEAAATHWELRFRHEVDSVEIKEGDLFAYVRELASDSDVLRTTRLRRRYEQRWLDVDGAIRRVVADRMEVAGARIATMLSVTVVTPTVLLLTGGAMLHAVALAVVLALGGGLALVRFGSTGLMRATLIQVLAIMAVLFDRYGVLAAFVALYLPVLTMAFAAAFGARAGARLVPWRHARACRTFESSEATRQAETGKAIAA